VVVFLKLIDRTGPTHRDDDASGALQWLNGATYWTRIGACCGLTVPLLVPIYAPDILSTEVSQLPQIIPGRLIKLGNNIILTRRYDHSLDYVSTYIR
jgi:hypothetical protein